MFGRRYLVLGPSTWRFGFRPPKPADSFVVVRVPDGPADVNTVLLEGEALAAGEWWHVRMDGTILANAQYTGPLLVDLLIREDIAGLLPEQTPAPLLVVGDTGAALTFFAELRHGARDVLAVWCGDWTGSELPTGFGARLAQAVLRGLRLIHGNRTFLNNHNVCFWRFKRGTEIEYKLTLAPEADVYGLSVRLRNLVGRAGLADYIWEYRDDFQQRDYDNHLYEVPGPPEEAGYISFVSDASGGVLVKRKWYAADALERRESKWPDVRLTVTEPEYIQREFGVDVRYLGAFRRNRFDIMLESVATGNVHAIMVDRCRFDNGGWPDLCQVEVEYYKTRSLRRSAGPAVYGELEQIVAATKAELDRLKVSYVDSYLSKLTYMREHYERTVHQQVAVP